MGRKTTATSVTGLLAVLAPVAAMVTLTVNGAPASIGNTTWSSTTTIVAGEEQRTHKLRRSHKLVSLCYIYCTSCATQHAH